jgi:hypothetical protein
MPTNIWTGAADTDWNNTANWSLGAIPVNGDDIVFSSDATRGPELNISKPSLTPRSITVEYVRYNQGTDSAPIETGALSDSFNFMGLCASARFSCATVPKARIHLAANTTFIAHGGTWQDVELSGGGTVKFAAASVVASGGNAVLRSMGPTVELEYNATVAGTLHQVSGTVVSARSIGTPNLQGPGTKLVLKDTAGVTVAGEVGSGATLNYRGSGGLSPTAAIELKPGGRITCEGNPNSSVFEATPAGTTFAAKINKYRGSSFTDRSGAFKFNTTNVTDIGQASSTSALTMAEA